MQEMTAGAELDSLIATKVFNWPYSGSTVNGRPFHDVWEFSSGGGYGLQSTRTSEAIPSFSIDISAAWKVVERMDSLGWHVVMIYKVSNGKKSCAMSHANFPAISAYADTIPLAVCIAALRAVEGK